MAIQPYMVLAACLRCGCSELLQPKNDVRMLPPCQLCKSHMAIIRSATLTDKINHPIQWLQSFHRSI